MICRVPPLLTALAALVMAGCATTTTLERRITADPAKFEALSPKHQTLVREGSVTEGMTPDAVYLAWGRPHEVKQSSRNGRSQETWIYYGTESMQVRTVGIGLGVGHGYGGYCGPGPFYDVGYDYAYRDFVAAKVEFEKDRVVFWERNRR